MPTRETFLPCPRCGTQTPHLLRTPNLWMHLGLTLLSGGLWLPVWLVIAFRIRQPICTRCNALNEPFRSTLRFASGATLLGAAYLWILFALIERLLPGSGLPASACGWTFAVALPLYLYTRLGV